MAASPRLLVAGAGTVLSLAGGLVAHYEGMIPHTYADPVGIPTICYGHTGPDVTAGRTATPEECEQLLHGDLQVAYGQVRRCIGRPLLMHEDAALTSFVFNVGGENLCQSTLARLANQGAPGSVWCAQLDRWVYSTRFGITLRLPGLVRRRAAERAMCEGRAPA